MLSILKRLADNKAPGSLSNRLRKKRFIHFMELIKLLPRPLKVIDVGGTITFWERMGFTGQEEINITILNLKPESKDLPGFVNVTGDARDLHVFKDNEFDIAFSNSVIEHVGNFEDQKMMAEEMLRIGKRVFLQTPNRYFPIEPHFLFPFFQFFPQWLKVRLLMNFRLGWYERISDKRAAIKICNSIRLLTKNELLGLFPGASIHKEKFLGMIKSFIVLK
jgi:SAM-dependent methyltransferase